ncbi:Aste57867_2930 [Aphanomyces stellatus]|uniref:tRNA (guanine(46)-N(7))-methyltransferase n=1 Tax=Aphanomyces stellatus TaxID=120398 RepID=A0A485KCX2_9STRA|nr:hypothetical protein As57867_002922 [Aphanomyces stellatus]VFT80113.1 Aste57867_2930 [Aphanomyces stellatus]
MAPPTTPKDNASAKKPFQKKPFQKKPFQKKPYEGGKKPYEGGKKPYEGGKKPYEGGKKPFVKKQFQKRTDDTKQTHDGGPKSFEKKKSLDVSKKPFPKKPFHKASDAPTPNPALAMKRKFDTKPSSSKKPKKDDPETVKLNKLIATCASRKQLVEAQAAFDSAVNQGLANAYTYVNMMNVCVRCGMLQSAIGIFDKMQTFAKLVPDVVAYTTLLKGLCGDGRLADAMSYVKQMEAAKVPLNVRTVNTLLRGCILTGDVAVAESVFQAATTRWQVTPDVSTWEYVVALLCRNLQLKKALSVFGRGLLACGDAVGGNAAILLHVARAAALLGDTATATKYLAMTAAALETVQPLAANEDDSNEGGKRGWGADSESRRESLAVFLANKKAELRREMGLIERYLGDSTADDNDDIDATLAAYKRVFLIPLDGDDDGGVSPTALAHGVLDTMGLRQLLKKHRPDTVDSIEPKFAAKLKGPVLRMRKVFGTKETPLKVEICSGAGEWIVAQAAADAAAARWVAMEIRHDRVCQIFAQAVLERVRNLAIVAGDAAVALQRHLAPGLADFVFVNQPEPPQQTGTAAATTQAKHLLTPAFLADCVRFLKLDGRLTIVTDNKWYAQLLLKTVAKLDHVAPVPLKKTQTAESIAGFHIYLGHPPKECGVADEGSSSYFDRLAKQDKIRASQSTYFISIARKE